MASFSKLQKAPKFKLFRPENMNFILQTEAAYRRCRCKYVSSTHTADEGTDGQHGSMLVSWIYFCYTFASPRSWPRASARCAQPWTSTTARLLGQLGCPPAFPASTAPSKSPPPWSVSTWEKKTMKKVTPLEFFSRFAATQLREKNVWIQGHVS